MANTENTIQAAEYEEFMKLREQIEQGLEEAGSLFMLTTYKQLRSVLNKRQLAANKLNISLGNARIRELTAKKREELKTKEESAS